MAKINDDSKNGTKGEVELYRIFLVEPLQVATYEGELIANWDKLRWKDGIKIGRAIAGPVAAILQIDIDKIVYKEIIQDIHDGVCQASVAFFTDLPQSQIDPHKQILDEAISSFLGYIYLENRKNLDLFDGNLDQDNFKTIVREHAIDFLKNNGDTKISTPIQVNGFSFQKKCSGRFSDKPIVIPGKQITKTLQGRIISMMCDKTEFVVKQETEDPATISYSKNIFFHALKKILGEPMIGDFLVHESTDPHGRIFLVLDSIDNVSENLGPLI